MYSALGNKKLRSSPKRTPTAPVHAGFIAQAVELFLQLLAIILNDGINSRREWERHLTPELGRMRDAQNCFLSQPISHSRPVKTSGELADAQILFCRDFTTNIARLCSIRVQLRLTQDSDKSLSGSRCVLNGSETPGVKITQAMSLRLRSLL